MDATKNSISLFAHDIRAEKFENLLKEDSDAGTIFTLPISKWYYVTCPLMQESLIPYRWLTHSIGALKTKHEKEEDFDHCWAERRREIHVCKGIFAQRSRVPGIYQCGFNCRGVVAFPTGASCHKSWQVDAERNQRTC